MNLVFQIFQKYLLEEKWMLLLIVAMSFAINYLQTNMISQITASIIDSIEHSNFIVAFASFYSFVAVSVIYLVLNSVSEICEMRMLTKLTQWMRHEFLKFILISNNESFDTDNAIKYSSPINRVSFAAYSMISSVITHIITNVAFILVITGYFLMNNAELGAGFLLANVALAIYIWIIWDPLMEHKNVYEKSANENESYVIDMLNNFDKIIYRGQAEDEVKQYKKRSEKCVETAQSFYENVQFHVNIMYLLIYGTILTSLWYLIRLAQGKTLDTKTFIAFMSILLIYRDKLTSIVQIIPNYLEFNGRMEFAINQLADLKGDYANIDKTKYTPTDLAFDTLTFKHVYYKYRADPSKAATNKRAKPEGAKGPEGEKGPYLFEDLSLQIEAKHNIVGITGLSGRGKSTLMKLLLKMHACEKGSIEIDGVDVRNIDPTYIRKNIVYVNQTSKLFDKKIVENMMYGCEDEDACKKYLDIVLGFPKIKGLYKNIDLATGSAGPLGEKLSGGQRQIANIISGLVHPSHILILDEPTNALDGELKSEILQIIEEFRAHKKCIIVITHDRDVFPLLDQRINL